MAEIKKLSKKEKVCLDLLSKGYSAKFIAKILGRSKKTVETHFFRIKLKTGLTFKDYLLFAYHSGELQKQGYL